MSRIVVEWVKEATVNFIVGDCALDEKPQWEKCKLRLVKASGGFLLEFFAPPKVPLSVSLFFSFSWTAIYFLESIIFNVRAIGLWCFEYYSTFHEHISESILLNKFSISYNVYAIVLFDYYSAASDLKSEILDREYVIWHTYSCFYFFTFFLLF